MNEKTQGQTQQGHGNFIVERRYEPERTARLDDGRIVRVQEFGNQEGMSPAYKGVDELGQTIIASTDRFTWLDLSSIPPSAEQVRKLLGSK